MNVTLLPSTLTPNQAQGLAPVMCRVAVVLLNWNGSHDTIPCAHAVLGLNYEPFDLIVCDNESNADDVRTLALGLRTLAQESGREFVELATENPAANSMSGNSMSNRSAVVLLHTGGNLGFAGGVNVGLRYALSLGNMDCAWVLNNDTTVDPGALTAMVQRMLRDPSIGICGSSLVYFGDRDKVQAHGGAAYRPWRGRSIALGAFTATRDIPRDPSAVEAQMDYVVGASMLVSRRFIETVGLMDDSYFLYSEEHDWAHRGRRLGFKLAWAPDSIVYHKHGATIGTAAQGGSPLSLFYLFRSKALFARRNTPLRLPVVLMSLLWESAKFALKGQPGKAWASLRGLMAFPGLKRY